MNEKELLKQAIARIHILCEMQGIDVKDDPILNLIRLEQEMQPLSSAVADTVRKLKLIKQEINEKIQSFIDKDKRNQEWLDQTDDKTFAMDFIEKEQSKIFKKNEFYQNHLDYLENKILALQHSPKTMFLPLGTVVRFNGKRPVANSLSILPELGWKSYPVKGSIGVVTKLNHRSEYPIGVSMRRPFEDNSGEGKFYPDYDSLITYNVDHELLEVVEQGTLPDGKPFTGYGWIPTHHINKADQDKTCNAEYEMILYADSFYWRLHDFGGQQSVECLQSFERLEKMSWVGSPLEIYTKQITLNP